MWVIFVDERENDTNDVESDNNATLKRHPFYLKQFLARASYAVEWFGLQEFDVEQDI